MRVQKRVLEEHISAEMVRRLIATDGYVLRKADTGQPVPEAIKAYRAKVRRVAGELKAMEHKPFDFASDTRWPAEPV